MLSEFPPSIRKHIDGIEALDGLPEPPKGSQRFNYDVRPYFLGALGGGVLSSSFTYLSSHATDLWLNTILGLPITKGQWEFPAMVSSVISGLVAGSLAVAYFKRASGNST
jgi:hypothetical protein